VAIDLRTGDRVWEQDIGSSSSPWVAGDFIYAITNESAVVCLTRRDGRVRWVLDLPRFDDPDKKKEVIAWAGPVLAGDRLIVVSSDGDALSISPYTGQALGRLEISSGSYIAPVLANMTLYILDQNADLVALR